MPNTDWRYGMYVAEHGGPGGTAWGSDRQGCINMLAHDMEHLHHASGGCTCGQYRKDRLRRVLAEHMRCQPCKDLVAAQQQLYSSAAVTYRGRVFYYQQGA